MARRWTHAIRRELLGSGFRPQFSSGSSSNVGNPPRFAPLLDHARLDSASASRISAPLFWVCGTDRRYSGVSGKRLKERGFDEIIEREKKLKVVLGIKNALASEPSRSMTLLELGKRREDTGLDGRVVTFLKRYPGVFRVHETASPGKLPWFHLTPEAESVLEEELALRAGMHPEAVAKLRKLLMMSSQGRLPLAKLAHLGRDLGLPNDFKTNLVSQHPNYFRVVGGQDPELELVRWSSRLAVTEAEKQALSAAKRSRLDETECPSPYEDGTGLHHRSVEFEKRAVLVVRELLSLTLEKRLLVDHLTHFRQEFHFSKKVYGMLMRHPEHFYVSRKGSRDTVFLREGFEEVCGAGNGKEHCLIDNHPLVMVKAKFAALMEVVPVDGGHVPFQERAESEGPAVHVRNRVPW